MNKVRTLLTLLFFGTLVNNVFAGGITTKAETANPEGNNAFAGGITTKAETANPDEMVAYLFTYFNSNKPEDEQICYALSDDGYNFKPLNNGAPVISSDTIATVRPRSSHFAL